MIVKGKRKVVYTRNKGKVDMDSVKFILHTNCKRAEGKEAGERFGNLMGYLVLVAGVVGIMKLFI